MFWFRAQWHQWLRQVRDMPPSIAEQQQDVARLQNIKKLARLADERWENKPSLLRKPSVQSNPATAPEDPRTEAGGTEASKERGMETVAGSEAEAKGVSKGRGPSEQWQPEMWKPKPGAARR
ncbi:hypothetical protein FGG08_004473 [Glutinoglossum americanum]|uniref:NADH dehydrogenase [ubiquinone] 1 alpha subcomplex subunit n=1 Tax=Glutinoglossum americanum TaxID=1670608 RepID=A0A9P8I7G1_9PEZI|nr:hypothetical protein FGG08_004473 [Glutinoglossum americanum]